MRRFMAALVVALIVVSAASASSSNPSRNYARTLAAAAGWTGYQWDALDAIVQPESGWDPCARFPSRHECGYKGSNSCGIPQRSPCPLAWRGRLAASWREQVRELIAYIRRRYGTPAAALAFRRAHGWY